MSSSASSRRRHGGTAAPPPTSAPGSQEAEEARDWASLPRDMVLDIFLRLGPREVMLGAEFACKPWRRVALEESSLWRRIGMESAVDDDYWRCRDQDVEMAMNLVAVDRAAGQCEAFKGDCDDDYLFSLVERAPSLKCLCINEHYSDHQTGEDLIEALMKLPLLEELEICFKYVIIDHDGSILKSICRACPQLKELVLMHDSCYEGFKEPIDEEIPMMLKLHTLELYDCDLRVEGLEAILDSCPVLETLHIEGYFDRREMDKELRMKCARVKNLTLPTRISADIGSEDEYYYSDTYSEDDDSDTYSEDDDSMEEY